MSVLALLATAAPALAGGETSESFEGGFSLGRWTFASFDTQPPTGGNPGAWLSTTPFLSTFAPIAQTTDGFNTPFVGDYRAKNVTQISFDARTDSVDFGANGFEMSVLLRDTKGTPSVNDDDYAYFVGPQVPLPGDGWLHYDFAIPSASTDAVPAGWTGGWVGDLENFRPGVDWNDVIQSVDRVEIWWINPAFFALIQFWHAGIDNITITEDPSARVFPYGCGINPAASLAVQSGLPSLGSTVVFEVTDPTASLTTPAVPLLMLSLQPDVRFPCGTAIPGWGLGAPGSDGELLINTTGIDPFLIRQGPLWTGSPVSFNLDIPIDNTLIGVDLFLQGLLVDAALRPGLTRAAAVCIGP